MSRKPDYIPVDVFDEPYPDDARLIGYVLFGVGLLVTAVVGFVRWLWW